MGQLDSWLMTSRPDGDFSRLNRAAMPPTNMLPAKLGTIPKALKGLTRVMILPGTEFAFSLGACPDAL